MYVICVWYKLKIYMPIIFLNRNNEFIFNENVLGCSATSTGKYLLTFRSQAFDETFLDCLGLKMYCYYVP
jgi:hypothetical protein